MKNKKYWLIGSGSSSCRRMMADLENVQLHDFEYVPFPVAIENKIVKKLFDFYFRLNAKFRMPCRNVWEKYFTFPKCSKDDENYVILLNGVFNYYTSKFLNEMREKYNIHYIMVLIDPLSGFSSGFMKKELFNTKYDFLYSFDADDAKALNAKHTMSLYSKRAMTSPMEMGGGYTLLEPTKKTVLS